jgi:hypothetical protein
MKKIPQLIITIAVFIGSTIGIDFLVGALTTTDVLTRVYLTNFGNFPGQNGLNYIEDYLGFMQADILGWFTYVMSSASQSLETLASGLYVSGGVLTFDGPSGSAVGIIPILIEYHPWSSNPTIFLPTLFALIRLIGPFIITGIVAGAVAKEKKDAIKNALLTFLIVGAAGIIMNIIHISYNFVPSIEWKFSAYLSLNPAFQAVYDMNGGQYVGSYVGYALMDLVRPYISIYTVEISIIAGIYALINGLICSIISVMVAAKK